MTERSSGEAPRALLLAVLLAVSEAWVAMCTPSLRTQFLVVQPGFIPGKNISDKTPAKNLPIHPALFTSDEKTCPPRPAPHARQHPICQKRPDRRKVRRGRAVPDASVGDSPGERGKRLRLRTACLYGQTRFVLSPPLAVLATATGRAASEVPAAPPSRMRAATRNASISACKPEIWAWKMAIGSCAPPTTASRTARLPGGRTR